MTSLMKNVPFAHKHCNPHCSREWYRAINGTKNCLRECPIFHITENFSRPLRHVLFKAEDARCSSDLWQDSCFPQLPPPPYPSLFTKELAYLFHFREAHPLSLAVIWGGPLFFPVFFLGYMCSSCLSRCC